jgi:DNA-directed RNA polymerase subunit N (RpoN/RPB10)
LIKCITSTVASYHNAIVGNLNIIIKKTPQEEDDVAIRSYNRRTQPPSTKPWLTCGHMRNHQFHSNSTSFFHEREREREREDLVLNSMGMEWYCLSREILY